ncbi:hypothetical protein C883_3409 [Bacillus stratosphericus LAMA 585]|nr:hypothetical protein C883_3409 [Bacillus stratosphericus LAMA 585]
MFLLVGDELGTNFIHQIGFLESKNPFSIPITHYFHLLFSICLYFSYRCCISSSEDNGINFFRDDSITDSIIFACDLISFCAPPFISGMISSIIPKCFKSFAEIFICLAASGAYLASFHRIDAAPSGEITEYHEYSNIWIWLPTLIPRAPPLDASPITIQTIGTLSVAISNRFRAIASEIPRSSDPLPG